MLATAWPFIELDDRGRPLIKGTRMKVLLLIRHHLGSSLDAEELHHQYPQFSLAQIHAALGYYYENQAECDRRIAEEDATTDELLAKMENPRLQEKLRAAMNARNSSEPNLTSVDVGQ